MIKYIKFDLFFTFHFFSEGELSSNKETKPLKTKAENLTEEKKPVIHESKGERKELTNDVLKTIDNRYFLSISQEKRLQYITKNNIDSQEIISGNIRKLEFTFTFDGVFNKDLYVLTTAGQVLPNEVRGVKSNGILYERIGLNGEFYNKETNKRLVIKEGTRLDIEKIGNQEEISVLKKETSNKYNTFIKENPEYSKEEYKNAICEIYNKGLGNIEVKFILTSSYDQLSKLDSQEAKKLLIIARHLDNSGYLDSFTDAGEIIRKIEDILLVVKKYGNGLKYSINKKGDIHFKLNEKGIPEGIDIEPNLENFTKIALSQLGTNEYDGGSNKYLSSMGYYNLDSKDIPWCAAFINWSLQMSGFRGTHSLAAKSFIQGSGFGHVGIKLGDKILGGNQGNRVSLMKITKEIVGYSIPTKNGLEIHNGVSNISEIPDGAIIVFNRNPKNKTYS